MTDYCPVCRGEKRIRIPLYHEVSVNPEPADVICESYREYPCPECGPLRIKVEKFSAGKVMTFMDAERLSEPARQHWRENATKHMAHMITAKLIEDGLIEFTKLEPDAYYGEGMQASVYVATPKHWEPIEERIAERQMEVASEVADEAIRLIDNWGSYYCHADILKSDARREIREAVKRVREKRAKK